MISFNKENIEEKEMPQTTISLEKITSILKEILTKRFPNDYERQRIIPRLNGTRLNFCCPYCGDSHIDSHKKRGNFYSRWLYYKCYNGGCEQYVDFEKLMKDFHIKNALSEEETQHVKNLIAYSKELSKNDQIRRYELSLDKISNVDFTKILVPRNTLIERLGLMEIHPKSPMGIYLNKRKQIIDKKFAWDPRRKNLYIFNLDSSKEWIFSLQTRQFDNDNSKYLTYNLSGIWSKLLKVSDVDHLAKTSEYDHISTIFGILTINFNEMITLFEGPMDSFLFNNSCGMCSINNDWPFDMNNYRWFQDNDDAGRKKALHVIKNGISIFMWKKFIEDFELFGKKIKDLNDIVIYEAANNLRFGDLTKYFSQHRYDGIYL